MEQGNKALVTAMSIRMLVEVIKNEQGEIKGALYSKYLEEPFEFVNMVVMIQKMEEVFDAVGFPQAFMATRTFSNEKRVMNKHDVEGSVFLNRGNDKETDGKKCTFEISVRFRQNASWQGQIFWSEKNMRQNFRSVLEMLKLMDEALTEGNESETVVEWK